MVLNDNECLADSAVWEYAFGFRGAATLVLLFAVLINIELTYNGEVKDRNRRQNDPQSLQRNPGASGNGDDNPQPIEVDLNVQNKATDRTQGNHTGIDESDETTVR